MNYYIVINNEPVTATNKAIASDCMCAANFRKI